ncbi:MAG: helix-turn-helix domain-containing protein [Clostridia bacterium]|nr:helix-turn-helix domain-containing protein [Clostridia bacterium]
MSLSDVLKRRRSELGYTLLEIADKMGVSEATVQRWESGNIKSLRHGRISQLAEILKVSPSALMGWEEALPDNILSLPKFKNVPLLGTIACGEPILATENIEMFVKVDESIPADFALKCKGDSMINARIFDGDIVYIRSQPDVEDGEIAAVLIGDEATLKKVHKFSNKIVLSPCNPMYDDLIYSNEQLAEIRILGKAVAFFSLIR